MFSKIFWLLPLLDETFLEQLEGCAIMEGMLSVTDGLEL
jgi:hypothetical protein